MTHAHTTVTARPVNIETLVWSNFGRWFDSEILLLLSDFIFFSLLPFPLLIPSSLTPFFFFFSLFPTCYE